MIAFVGFGFLYSQFDPGYFYLFQCMFLPNSDSIP
jgi:hypothetical protein